jgi:hypothetical protein
MGNISCFPIMKASAGGLRRDGRDIPARLTLWTCGSKSERIARCVKKVICACVQYGVMAEIGHGRWPTVPFLY